MISKTRPAFWRAYGRLAPSVKARAREAYRVFEQNPEHPSLRFKKLRARDDLWSVRINEKYRAVGVRTGDTIGTHNEFENLFS